MAKKQAGMSIGRRKPLPHRLQQATPQWQRHADPLVRARDLKRR